ncbi:MAG TPA: DNA gyrase inhibitor YacG [Azospirillaceae bacterium]|nr:DNA gyrase inhibitor YacG [Azospirillaceae bacterium]
MAKCPICNRPTEPDFRPFCSKRCREVDLSRWLGGVYRIPVNDPEAEIEDGEEAPRGKIDEE